MTYGKKYVINEKHIGFNSFSQDNAMCAVKSEKPMKCDENKNYFVIPRLRNHGK